MDAIREDSAFLIILTTITDSCSPSFFPREEMKHKIRRAFERGHGDKRATDAGGFL